MGLTSPHSLGRNQKFFINEEGTAGTFAKPAGTDAAKVLASTFTPNIVRNDRTDPRAHRDIVERITGKSEHSWSCEKYLLPSGTVDTPPDDGPLLEGGFGTQTINGSTSVVYSTPSVQTLKTYTLTRHFSGGSSITADSSFMESMIGAWVNSITITADGGSEPKISYEGGAMSYVATGTGTLNGAMAASATMVVTAAGTHAFAVGSVVQIGTDDNSSAGFEVTVDSAAPSFTIEANATANDASLVIPFTPAETTAGSPIAGISGSFTWDSFAAKVISFECTLNNNIKPLADEAQVQNVSDIIPGMREITGSMNVRMRRDHVIHVLNRKAFAVRALTVVLGTGTGTKFTISMPYCELEFSAANVPESEEVTIPMNFKALGSSGNDAITLTHS